jgi:hypothetical protein
VLHLSVLKLYILSWRIRLSVLQPSFASYRSMDSMRQVEVGYMLWSIRMDACSLVYKVVSRGNCKVASFNHHFPERWKQDGELSGIFSSNLSSKLVVNMRAHVS